ncbi:MAG TPA: glycerophosphodiester phosphodiesterase family protein, partial [Polyangiales bacterium]|nr:glycerophosphodiester phosphodiesterase family protein [Polyangiales bacterium]
MRSPTSRSLLALVLGLASLPSVIHADDTKKNIQVGPRPYYLVDQLSPGPLKDKLESCADKPLKATEFSIGHRGGGTLQFPEHTKQSHEAGARMGAGILECDVTFTSDGELVCRHDQCDLHTTTDILVTPLADKCTKPFAPAEFDDTGALTTAASALCCTSDLTLEEFKQLKGKMDASNPNALTPKEFLGGTASYRTDLYATGGTLLTHRESIELIHKLGAKYTPELKSPNRDAKLQVEDVFGSQAAYAKALIDEYKAAGVAPEKVWAQSFDQNDVLTWISYDAAFGKQAVFLDDAELVEDLPTAEDLQGYVEAGIRIVAPPTFALLTVKDGKIVPSDYAKAVKAAGLGIITWTLERSG